MLHGHDELRGSSKANNGKFSLYVQPDSNKPTLKVSENAWNNNGKEKCIAIDCDANYETTDVSQKN